MLYLITNRNLAINKNFYSIIQETINAGISAIILREKDLYYEQLLSVAIKIKKIIGNSTVKLIINNNLEVANAVASDGFHTNFENFIKEKPCFIGTLGVSVHSLEEAIAAEKNGAHYLLAGHIFQTDCKKNLPPKGIEFIRVLKQQVSIPIIALGGIKPENIGLVRKAGSDGVAVMSSIMQAENPYALIKELKFEMTNDT